MQCRSLIDHRGFFVNNDIVEKALLKNGIVVLFINRSQREVFVTNDIVGKLFEE